MSDEENIPLLEFKFKPGDIVCLAEDNSSRRGVGIVLKVKRDLTDALDLILFSRKIANSIEHTRKEDVFLRCPQILVSWRFEKNIWMFESELDFY